MLACRTFSHVLRTKTAASSWEYGVLVHKSKALLPESTARVHSLAKLLNMFTSQAPQSPLCCAVVAMLFLNESCQVGLLFLLTRGTRRNPKKAQLLKSQLLQEESLWLLRHGVFLGDTNVHNPTD